MIPAIVPVLVTGVVLAAPPATEAPDNQPTLAFTQDGEDLIVTAKVEIVDAPHVLWAHGDVVTVRPVVFNYLGPCCRQRPANGIRLFT